MELVRKLIGTGRGSAVGSHTLTHCLVMLGRMDEAREVARALMKAEPGYTLAASREQLAAYDSAFRDRRLASLRAAGIPES